MKNLNGTGPVHPALAGKTQLNEAPPTSLKIPAPLVNWWACSRAALPIGLACLQLRVMLWVGGVRVWGDALPSSLCGIHQP